METINFTKLIGDEVFAVVTMLHPVHLQKLIIRGVEGGGVWIEVSGPYKFYAGEVQTAARTKSAHILFIVSRTALRLLRRENPVPE